MSKWSETRKAVLNAREVGDVQVYDMRFPDGYNLKVDFAYYPCKQVESTTLVDAITVGSKLDIAVNKTVASSQRTDVKDFVDLYFLLDDWSE